MSARGQSNRKFSKLILLAEDSSDDEVLFRRVLNSLGVVNPIHVVRDGKETIAFLKREGVYAASPVPAALFLDLKMPGMDGWEVLRWLSTQKEKPEMLVIVLTAFGDRQQLQKAYQLGANSFLFKPIEAPEVLDVIQHWPGAWMHANPAKPPQSRPKTRKTPAPRKKSEGGGVMDAMP